MDAHNQPQQPAVFDWELCADLHNRIIDLGWAPLLEEMDYEPDTDSWWENQFGSNDEDSSEEESKEDSENENDPDDPETEANAQRAAQASALESRLHPDVVKFLKKARHDYPGVVDSCHLFYYLKAIPRPVDIISLLNDEMLIGPIMRERDRYVWLYTLPRQSGGLVLDQQTMKVVIFFHHDITYVSSNPDDPNDPPWGPLEMILSSFMEMIEQKRIIAIPLDSNVNNGEEPLDWEDMRDWNTPWILSEEDDKVVDDTIAAWNELLAAIESRIPGFEDNEQNTYDSQYIEDCKFNGFFISKFVQNARIPKFRYVAPGLRLSQQEELAYQPFKKLDLTPLLHPRDPVGNYKRYPFLFLRADREVLNVEGKYTKYPWDRAPVYETGLYLENTKSMERADGCKLLLPFAVTSNRHARYSDLTVIKDYQSHDGLYQSGWGLMLQEGIQRLELVFKSWKNMVEQGHWLVDENGIICGIDKFKEADTLDKWNLYMVQRSW